MNFLLSRDIDRFLPEGKPVESINIYMCFRRTKSGQDTFSCLPNSISD
jgi:hypothetical protein